MNERKRLTGLMPGCLRVSGSSTGSKRYIACRPVDVSVHGFGILSSTYLEIDQELELETSQGRIFLRVNNKKKDDAKSNLYRYSLVLIGKSSKNSPDLCEVFLRAGCYETGAEKSSGSAAKKTKKATL